MRSLAPAPRVAGPAFQAMTCLGFALFFFLMFAPRAWVDSALDSTGLSPPAVIGLAMLIVALGGLLRFIVRGLRGTRLSEVLLIIAVGTAIAALQTRWLTDRDGELPPKQFAVIWFSLNFAAVWFLAAVGQHLARARGVTSASGRLGFIVCSWLAPPAFVCLLFAFELSGFLGADWGASTCVVLAALGFALVYKSKSGDPNGI